MNTILIVDDSEDDAVLLLRELKKNGLTVHSQRVESDISLRKSLSEGDWDLIISDHNLPGYSSTEALQTIRELNSDIPVIIVSGEISELDAIKNMRNGAQDYVMKDNLARLIPAIESPIAASTIADSQIGVFLTRSFPNCFTNPSVILKTPPYSAMSCPIITKSL